MLVHGVIILALLVIWPDASSKGQGQVMLLEAVNQHTTLQPSAQPRQASEASMKTDTQSKDVNAQGERSKVKAASDISKVQQTEQRQTTATSSNQGRLEDQSGKTQTPQDAYQQQLLKHLLNKMGSAPEVGQANIQLTLMSAGIAIEVNIELLEGSATYERWLKSKVLNANPFPPIPKNLKQNQFHTQLKVNHFN